MQAQINGMNKVAAAPQPLVSTIDTPALQSLQFTAGNGSRDRITTQLWTAATAAAPAAMTTTTKE